MMNKWADFLESWRERWQSYRKPCVILAWTLVFSWILMPERECEDLLCPLVFTNLVQKIGFLWAFVYEILIFPAWITAIAIQRNRDDGGF